MRDHQVVDTQGKWILDAGCGSGFKLQALAAANPGSHIVGVDISQKSIDFFQKRLDFHGVKNPAEFYCISIEDLPNIKRTFDYINCDEVLYFLLTQ